MRAPNMGEPAGIRFFRTSVAGNTVAFGWTCYTFTVRLMQKEEEEETEYCQAWIAHAQMTAVIDSSDSDVLGVCLILSLRMTRHAQLQHHHV